MPGRVPTHHLPLCKRAALACRPRIPNRSLLGPPQAPPRRAAGAHLLQRPRAQAVDHGVDPGQQRPLELLPAARADSRSGAPIPRRRCRAGTNAADGHTPEPDSPPAVSAAATTPPPAGPRAGHTRWRGGGALTRSRATAPTSADSPGSGAPASPRRASAGWPQQAGQAAAARMEQ
jgi:hypothetical protein